MQKGYTLFDMSTKYFFEKRRDIQYMFPFEQEMFMISSPYSETLYRSLMRGAELITLEHASNNGDAFA